MKLINKSVVLLVFSLVLLLSIGSVCASDDIGVSDIDNSDLGVSSLSEVPVDDNNVNNLGANPGSFSDLQTLIDDTSSGATLDLSDDYSFNQNTDDDEGISITKDITINGNGHTLDGKNLARIFNITQSNVIITNLNFINANAKDDYSYYYGYGGAIYCEYGNLTVVDCAFINNSARGDAAICCHYGNLTVDNCSFINNFGMYGSGAISCDMCFSLMNSFFVNNSAAGYDGGAIYCSGSYEYYFKVDNCSFVNNSAMRRGGVIYLDCVSKDVDSEYYTNFFTNSIFINNFAGSAGGAIYINDESSGGFINCSFVNNSAGDEGGAIYFGGDYGLNFVEYSNFINNSAGDEGGAIYSSTSVDHIIYSNFTNNSALDDGGAIYNDQWAKIIEPIIYCNFVNCSALDDGGAIYNENYDNNLTFLNCNFVNCSALDDGGAIYNSGFTTMDNCSVINTSSGYYGAVYSYYDINVSNSNFINNSIIDNGSYGYGAAIYACENITVSNSTFVNNSILADYGGGAAIYADKSITVSNSTFINNSITADYGGGAAIYADYDSIIKDSFFINNHINVLNNGSGYGGAVYALYAGDISNSTFVNNTIIGTDESCGGAIYSYDELKVEYCIFDANNATTGKDICWEKYENCSYSLDNNYWSMNFTTKEEFINADLVSIYDGDDTYSVAPDNWVLMSIYVPDELKVGVSAPIVVKLDKLTDGSSISDFTGSLPDYYTSAYAFTRSENDNYNYKWDNENPDVGSYIGNLWIRNGEGSFNFTAPLSGEYVFRTHSPFTIWEEAVTKLTIARLYNMSITESTLNKTVYVGNQTEFLIVVNNTGDSNLTGVYVVEKSSDDMVYDSWRPVSGNWVYSFVDGVHRWTLDGSLAPNETASFILVFNTTSVGNKTNIVLGGSNELDNLSAENTTEVINKTKPNPNPNPDPNPDPTPTPEPNPVPGNGGSDSVVSKMVSTGNPLALIIISLFTIFVGGLKRKI